jgi:hypothetical protein
MRRVSSVLLSLTAGLVLFSGLALSESRLRPLPVVAGGYRQAVTAEATDQAGLQRAGYVFEDKYAAMPTSDRRERSYSFHGELGSSALLVDNEYPHFSPTRREVVFDIVFRVPEGQSPTDMRLIAPRLVAAMRRGVSEDPAIVAGLGYLATAAGSGVAPEALQAAVIDYVRRYQQPSALMHEVCSGCASADGFSDEYLGGPDVHSRLNVAQSGWTIAGTRQYANGNSAFTVRVAAKIPRS